MRRRRKWREFGSFAELLIWMAGCRTQGPFTKLRTEIAEDEFAAMLNRDRVRIGESHPWECRSYEPLADEVLRDS